MNLMVFIQLLFRRALERWSSVVNQICGLSVNSSAIVIISKNMYVLGGLLLPFFLIYFANGTQSERKLGRWTTTCEEPDNLVCFKRGLASVGFLEGTVGWMAPWIHRIRNWAFVSRADWRLATVTGRTLYLWGKPGYGPLLNSKLAYLHPLWSCLGHATLSLSVELEIQLWWAQRAEDSNWSVLFMPKEPWRARGLLYAYQKTSSHFKTFCLWSGNNDVSSLNIILITASDIRMSVLSSG